MEILMNDLFPPQDPSVDDLMSDPIDKVKQNYFTATDTLPKDVESLVSMYNKHKAQPQTKNKNEVETEMHKLFHDTPPDMDKTVLECVTASLTD